MAILASYTASAPSCRASSASRRRRRGTGCPSGPRSSFAGSLLNVAAGRVANRFNFGGLNFTIDAACSSALAAVGLAANELETGRSNVVIAGGIDVTQGPFAYLSFCKTQALSPTGRTRTFDKHADGIVISEGLAVLVMKRLADAERAGDRIYAVIKAVAGSSDGRALGLTAPRPEGQVRALNRAYAKAGFSPNTVGLMEAHGTGTTVGDRAELETIVGTLDAAGAAPQHCAVGSVKTLIGHLKAGAGAAGLVKAALALHHRTLPPHANVTEPLDAITRPESPVYLLKEAKPWLAEGDRPRRAAVSAFGFGGTNFHAVLEEYRQEYRSGAETPGGDRWPCELFVFRGRGGADLKREVERVRAALADGATPRLRDLALSLAVRAELRTGGAASASVVAANLGELATALDSVVAAVDGGDAVLPRHVSVNFDLPQNAPKVALLFPGQGSQYVNMGREQALYLAAFRRTIEEADRTLDGRLPRRLSDYMFPPADFTEESEAASRAALTATEVAQPAIGTISAAYLDVMRELGLEADMVSGHSYGEFTALHAATALSRADFLALSSARGRVMSAACNAPERGTMAAISARREEVEPMLADCADVVVANHNAPKQVVISGAEAGVRQAVEKFIAAGIDARLLPVAGAFHSPLMAPSKDGLIAAIAQSTIDAPRIPVYANATGRPYDAASGAVREQLGQHLLSSVEFVSQVEHMYADGARIFLELGPKSVLSSLAGLILKDRPHLTLSLDSGGLRGSLVGLGALFTQGVKLRVSQLFADREAQTFEIDALASQREPAASWYVSGGWSRAAADPVGKSARIPGLTLETWDEEQVQKPIQHPAPTPAVSRTQVNGAHLNGAHVNGASMNGMASSDVQRHTRMISARCSPRAPLPLRRTPRRCRTRARRLPCSGAGGAGHGGGVRGLSADDAPIPGGAGAGADAVPRRRLPGSKRLESRAIHCRGPPAGDPAAGAPQPAATPAPVVRHLARFSPSRYRSVGTAPVRPATSDAAGASPAASVPRDEIARMPARSGRRPHRLSGGDARARPRCRSRTRHRLDQAGRDPRRSAAAPADRNVGAGQPGDGSADPGQSAYRHHRPAGRGRCRWHRRSRCRGGSGGDAAAMTASVPREEVARILLGLVAERTGYPAEMLGLDRDVEAELGIELDQAGGILGGLQQRLPTEMSARVSQEMGDADPGQDADRHHRPAGCRRRQWHALAVAVAAPAAMAAALAGMPREEVARVCSVWSPNAPAIPPRCWGSTAMSKPNSA